VLEGRRADEGGKARDISENENTRIRMAFHALCDPGWGGV
jgi:hypothetical protein